MTYLSLDQRTADTQYRDTLALVLQKGKWRHAIQGVRALTVLGPPPMRFELKNGVPLITERRIGFWRVAIAEIFAFINGARTQAGLESYGCRWWDKWVTAKKCEDFGLPAGDLGPGSYGAAFHNFPMANGRSFNQFANLVRQIKAKPDLRTHFITPWIPYYCASDNPEAPRKVVVAPCHGWMHFSVIDGELDLLMFQRSADLPVGVPANMIQYAALLLAMAQVTGLQPGTFIHSFSDAHIYEDQIPAVEEMLGREPRKLPTMWTNPLIGDIFSWRKEDFSIDEYRPHPEIDIPVAI